MTDQIDKALRSPIKKVKDVDREIEYFDSDELLKRKRILAKKKKAPFKTLTISRCRDL